MARLLTHIGVQLRRDIAIAFRGGGSWFHTLFFFVMFAGFGGFAIGPDRTDLIAAAPGLVWLGACISLQISAIDLFRPDMEDGTLAVLAVEQESLVTYLTSRLCALGITVLLPMAIMVPLFYVLFGLTPGQGLLASVSLFLAMPALLLACLVAAALSAGMRTGGILGAGLSAPLIVPILIFGLGATDRMLANGLSLSPELLFLAAVTIFYAVILPPFTIMAIRFGLE